MSIYVLDGLHHEFVSLLSCMNNPGILAIKKHLEYSAGGRQLSKPSFPPSVKIGGTARIRLPGWIESVCTIIYLVDCTSSILMHFQIICISPRSGPIAVGNQVAMRRSWDGTLLPSNDNWEVSHLYEADL